MCSSRYGEGLGEGAAVGDGEKVVEWWWNESSEVGGRYSVLISIPSSVTMDKVEKLYCETRRWGDIDVGGVTKINGTGQTAASEESRILRISCSLPSCAARNILMVRTWSWGRAVRLQTRHPVWNWTPWLSLMLNQDCPWSFGLPDCPVLSSDWTGSSGGANSAKGVGNILNGLWPSVRSQSSNQPDTVSPWVGVVGEVAASGGPEI